MKDEFNSLLQKKMDRKDFLKHVGIGLVAVTGFTAVLKALNGLGGNTHTNSRARSSSLGYGNAPYGGGSESSKKTS